MSATLLSLAENYERAKHLDSIPYKSNNEKLIQIYDPSWNDNTMPYEVLTFLLDCYYCLPERPDLATLFCWQAINNTYNRLLLIDDDCGKVQDTKGIETLVDALGKNISNYVEYLRPYYYSLTENTYHFIASYILKGYAAESHGINQKYFSSSYKSFKSHFNDFFIVVKETYGKSYSDICNPTVVDGYKLDYGITDADADASRKIIHSFSLKIKELLITGKTEISEPNNPDAKYPIEHNDTDNLNFIMFGIIYASRCSNFHGNVASRLNSIYAAEDYYSTYFNLFLLEYIVLAISLNRVGVLSTSALEKLKANERLRILS